MQHDEPIGTLLLCEKWRRVVVKQLPTAIVHVDNASVVDAGRGGSHGVSARRQHQVRGYDTQEHEGAYSNAHA